MTKHEIVTPHGPLRLPVFLPDATHGAVRTLDSEDTERCGIECLMINTLHLSSNPGIDLIASQGGAHAFMGWRRPIASDSGGFQALSLTAGTGKLGKVTDEGIEYRMGKARARLLTAEKCIQRQFDLGTDIQFCLDHCTHPNAIADEQRLSVDRTLAWARRCKTEFDKQRETRAVTPLLFAVVQGGRDRELRRRCAEGLVEMGFDGFGFGGWPIGDDGRLVDEVGEVVGLLPANAVLHGLGIGKPENLVHAFRLGYRMFDCVLPTRDARHGRLFKLHGPPSPSPDFYECIYIEKEDFGRDNRPVDESCDGPCCTRYSRAYIHHLFKAKEQAGARLATLHNLRFYARVIEHLRDSLE